jgi:hypothetical protein
MRSRPLRRLLLPALVCLGALLGPVASSSASTLPWTIQYSSTKPLARTNAAMSSDAAGGVLLFGGSEGGSFYPDTWTNDGSSWTRQLPAAYPSARSGASMAYDPAIGEVVLFGGLTANGLSNETWTYNGTTWTKRSFATSPPVRQSASMAYDAATGDIVLFGGEGEGAEFGDTWIYNGSIWVQQPVATSPPARVGASMTYDEATGKIVLFGGNYFLDLYADTWTYDGTTWTEQSTPTSPSPREFAAMAYDPPAGKVVLFGGEYGITSGEPGHHLSDTWTYDGGNWTEQSPSDFPADRAGAAMAYDAGAGKLILFGGIHGNYEYRSDTWTYAAAPTPTATIAGAASGATYTFGQLVPTSFSCKDAGGPGIESCTDSTGSSSGAGHLDTLALGSHPYTVTARSSDGEVGTASITYTVVPAPATGGPGGGNGPGDGSGSSGAPSFTRNPAFSPRRFAVAASKSAHGGSKLDLSLSEAAQVTATIEAPAAGRRKGKQCVAPGSAPKGAKACKRYVAVGKVHWTAGAGASALPFSGEVGGKALKPGTYRASVVAATSAGARSAAKLAPFTILAP